MYFSTFHISIFLEKNEKFPRIWPLLQVHVNHVCISLFFVFLYSWEMCFLLFKTSRQSCVHFSTFGISIFLENVFGKSGLCFYFTSITLCFLRNQMFQQIRWIFSKVKSPQCTKTCFFLLLPISIYSGYTSYSAICTVSIGKVSIDHMV